MEISITQVIQWLVIPIVIVVVRNQLQIAKIEVEIKNQDKEIKKIEEKIDKIYNILMEIKGQ